MEEDKFKEEITTKEMLIKTAGLVAVCIFLFCLSKACAKMAENEQKLQDIHSNE